MGRLCERPGCSEAGAASYGMVPEDLLFWVDTLRPGDGHDTGVLCRRHADAMVVPRGWTLDDRREPQPRLFRPPTDTAGQVVRPKRRRASAAATPPEQLELEPTGTGDRAGEGSDVAPPWVPAFDADDDLDGLLHVQSPLLARAFRGTGRAK